jgi:cytochrome c-type biogenesis protein CcmH
MPLFLLISTLAAVLVAGVLWRAQRSGATPLTDDDAADWAVMVARRREIEDDPDIDPALRETLIAEWREQAATMQRSPLAVASSAGNATGRRGWLLPAGVVLVAVVVYTVVGDLSEAAMRVNLASIGAPSVMTREAPPRPGENHPGGKGSIEERIAELENKLQADPNNLEGWLILARSRGLQRDYAAAVKALEQAIKLAPGQPDILADLADATAMAQGEKMAGRPMQLVAEALKSDPGHQKSLALAATGAMQAGQREEAVKLWRTLQSQFTPDQPDYAQIDNILAQLGEGPATPGANATGTAAPGAEQPPSPAASAVAASGAVIRGQVALSPAALERLRKQPPPASAVLYVLAKAVAGPPMPLAVLRLPLTDLAAGRMVAFQLDDSQAMNPQLSLSKFKQVSVEARVSMTGNAIRQPGDWSAVRSPVAVGTEGVPLQIEPAAAGK